MEKTASTQQFVEIAGIKDGIVITKGGSYRLILSATPVNFALKSEEEQNSIIFQYQSFLNSLHFPIQIVMRSQRLDLSPYLKRIDDIKEKQSNELLKLQTEDYIDFVKELIKVANIMKKSFFVIVTYDPISLKGPSVIDKILGRGGAPESGIRVSESEYTHHKQELLERANTAANGLGGIGIHCVQLTTEEIIELFYKIYNPEVADKERVADYEALTSSYITETTGHETSQDAKRVEEESVIDNSAVVEDKNKQEIQQRESEADKQSREQISATPAKNPSPADKSPENGQETPVPPAGNASAQPPSNSPGQPVKDRAEPVAIPQNFDQSQPANATNTDAPTSGQTPPADNSPAPANPNDKI